jgi:hypothetical protein
MIIYLFLRHRRHEVEHALLSDFRLDQKDGARADPFTWEPGEVRFKTESFEEGRKKNFDTISLSLPTVLPVWRRVVTCPHLKLNVE